jgi:hypothetical protein
MTHRPEIELTHAQRPPRGGFVLTAKDLSMLAVDSW